MGRRLVALGNENPQMTIAAALERPGHPDLGQDAGQIAGCSPIGVPLADSLSAEVDVVIDFSHPGAVPAVCQLCAERRLPLVIATTGLESEALEAIESASHVIPVVWAPNMSLAVNLTMKMAVLAARALAGHSSGVDVEIVERHHRFKEDSPSGTALKFGELIAAEMGQTRSVHGREGRPGARPADEIGYHAVRAGDHPGEHTIYFGMLGESVELSVRATSRDSYAVGALEAARFAAGKPPAKYSMFDVLGLQD